MQRPPRPRHEQILDRRRFLRLLSYGAVMAVGTLAVYRYAAGTDPSAADAARAATMALTTFVFFQVFNVHNARFPDDSALGRHLFRNGKLWLALGVVVGLQVLATQVAALQRLVTDHDVHATLSTTDWLVVVAIASSILWFEELRKFMQRVRCRHGAGARVAPSPSALGGAS
jgi:Ca2+-transporting ATPase